MNVLSADRPNSNPHDDLFGHPRLNPTWLERCVETAVCAQRLIDMRQEGVVPDTAREAVNQFLKELEMLRLERVRMSLAHLMVLTNG